MAISKHSERDNSEVQLTLFPGDSHVSLSVMPGTDEARKMTATSGRKCAELLTRPGLLGSLVKTLLESMDWHSTEFFLTWKPSATKCGRSKFRLVLSDPPSNEKEFGSWPTMTTDHFNRNTKYTQGGTPLVLAAKSCPLRPWPTLTVNGNNNRKGASEKSGDGLVTAAKAWPTLRASPNENRQTNPSPSQRKGTHGQNLASVVRCWPTLRRAEAKNGYSAPSELNRNTPNLAVTAGFPIGLLGKGKYPTRGSLRGFACQRIYSIWGVAFGRIIRRVFERQMKRRISETLNPLWGELLMGYPDGWTALEDWETPSSPKSPT